MYLSFYELEKKPFQISADPSFLWLGEKHKEALAMLKYGIMDNRGFIMLTGDVGTGKTTLVNALINSLGPDIVVANISNPGLKRIEFLNHLGEAFDLGRKFSGKGEFLTAFKTFLENCHRAGKQVLLIIDEAQRLSRDMLEEIRLLSNIEFQDVKLLNIFFVGQDELNETLDLYENRALRQRMTLQYHLEPLSEQEIGEFIRHRLMVAGTGKKIFTPKAIREIFAFSKGYPRLANIICDHAMLSGYVSHKKTIDAPEIIDCADDLRFKRRPDAAPSNNTHSPTFQPAPQKPWIQKSGLTSAHCRLITVFLLAFFLIGFLYFPLRAGASFPDIMSYWKDQMRGPGVAVPNQMSESASEQQVIFKVENTVRPGGLEVGMQGEQNGGTLGAEGITSGRSEEQKSGGAENTGTDLPEDETIRGLEDATGTDDSEQEQEGQTPQPPSVFFPEPAVPALPGGQASGAVIPDSENRYTLPFEFDSNDITAEGYARLNKTAAIMKENPEATLTISGYTDSMGETPYNIMLSKFRADIAKNYLVSNGVSPEKITSVGRGADEPVGDNDTFEGRRRNRRVEVVMDVK